MAGRIPQSFIDELLNRVDIVDVIDARVPLKKQGSNWVACCPFHDEKTPSFTVSPTKQFYYCFGCGASGSAIGFLMEHEHLGFVEAVEALAATIGVEVPREGGSVQRDARSDALYAILAQAERYYREQLRAHEPAQRYLRQRGLSGATAARFGLGWAPEQWQALLAHCGEAAAGPLHEAGLINRHEDSGRRYDRFRGRVMFPIRDRRGRAIAFGGRVIGAGEPKYLNSPETPLFHKGRELYGLYEVRKAHRSLARILVVEGYLDVLLLAEHGIDYAVATLGTAATETHVERLFASAAEIVFCFDGDTAGRQAAWRALGNVLPHLHDGREARFLFLPEGSDPDDLVRTEGGAAFEERIAGAGPLADFFVERARADADTTTIGGRSRIVATARPLLARLPRGVYRELLIDRLAAEVGLASERMRAELERDAPAEQQPASATATARRPPGAIRMTPMRTVIALLLQRPDFAARIPDDHPVLSSTDDPGAQLLRRLLAQIEDAQTPHTGQLLEAWRDSAEQPYLQRLAGHEFAVDPQLDRDRALASELDGALERLAEQARRARQGSLLAAARERTLSAAEKAELRALLAAPPGST